MQVLNKHCNSKCELQTWSVSFEVTKKKGRKDETHKKEACELFLKPLQVFSEGFVCPLIVDRDLENWSCCVFLYFCLQSKTRKGARGFKV
jgi:hypothetical protein